MIDPMAAVRGAKEIAELVKKYNDIPLFQKIVDLQGQVVEIATERLELFTENQELKKKLELKTKIRFENPYYFQDGDEIPLCPLCFDKSSGELRIHLTTPASDYMGSHGRHCQNCDKVIVEGPSKGQYRF